MNTLSRKASCLIPHRPQKKRRGARVFIALFSLVLFPFSASAQDKPLTIRQEEGNSSTITGPGLKLTLSEASAFADAPAWKLTSFTWLSTKRSDSTPTGRGQLMVFDADTFSPAGKTYAEVNKEVVGLVATSATYADGKYVFRDEVILARGKSYYLLNSSAITTDHDPAAPRLYGFSTSQGFNNIERWQADATAWRTTVSADTPNFSATFIPVPSGSLPAR